MIYISSSNGRPINGILNPNNDTANGIITLETPNVAHGYQVNDIITIFIQMGTSMGVYNVPVVEVIDAFTVRVAYGSIPGWTLLVNESVTSVHAGDPVFNMYLNSGPNNNNTHSIRPDLLGFCSQTYQYQLDTSGASNSTFEAPKCFNVHHPSYLLLEISDPASSTLIQHAWGEENNPNIFAKLIIYPEVKIERFYPMNNTFNGPKIITDLSFRIWNPWHTLYNFHGKSWSATLVFITSQPKLPTLCY